MRKRKLNSWSGVILSYRTTGALVAPWVSALIDGTVHQAKVCTVLIVGHVAVDSDHFWF